VNVVGVTETVPEVEHPDGASVLEAAIDYLRRGWSPIPTSPFSKKAAHDWKDYQVGRATEAVVHSWFTESAYNVAIIPGPVSGGLAIRDFDDEAAYHRWAAAHPALAESLPTVRTGRGFHVYHRVADDVRVEIYRTRGKRGFGKISLGDGEYSGGAGSYVLAPPSIHPNRQRYEWVIPLGDEVPLIDPREAGLLECWLGSHDDVSGDAGHVVLPQSYGHAYDTEDTEHTSPNESAESSVSMVVVDARIEEVIQRTLPQKAGKRRHGAIFEVARALKAISDLASRPARDFELVVRRWLTLALPYINDKEFERTWFDFLDGWDRVKFAEGEGPLHQAFERAKQAQPPAWATRYDRPELRLLVCLLRELQRMAGQKSFPLSCRDAGRLIGVDYRLANCWLRGLVLEEVLKRTFRGSKASGKADEFRYLPED